MYRQCTKEFFKKFDELIKAYPYETLLAKDLSVSQSGVSTLKKKLNKRIKKETAERLDKLYEKYKNDTESFLDKIEQRAQEMERNKKINHRAGLNKYLEQEKINPITRRRTSKRKADSEYVLSDEEITNLRNGKYLKKLRKGEKYTFNKKSDLRGAKVTFSGRIEEEYPRFYLVRQNETLTTILKNDLYTDEYEVRI